MCKTVAPQGEVAISKGLAATPGPSWVLADPQLLAHVSSSQGTNEGCKGFTATHTNLEGNVDDEGKCWLT